MYGEKKNTYFFFHFKPQNNKKKVKVIKSLYEKGKYCKNLFFFISCKIDQWIRCFRCEISLS